MPDPGPRNLPNPRKPRKQSDAALSDAPDVSSAYTLDELTGSAVTLDVGPALAFNRGGGGVDLDNFGGNWAIEPNRGSQYLSTIQGWDLAAHLRQAGPVFDARAAAATRAEMVPEISNQITGRDDAPQTIRVAGKTVGLAFLSGPLTKRGSSLGGGADSTLRAMRHVRLLAADAAVDSIMVLVESPGGTVSGTMPLGREIAKARRVKPVIGWARDLAASAGYWLLSQCTNVYANCEIAVIGSIGAYIALYDFSGFAKKEKIEAVVMRSRADKPDNVKGWGFPGTEVTAEQRAMLQAAVDRDQDYFSLAIASSPRPLDLAGVERLANGRVWMADEAVGLGLIDGIADLDQVMAAIVDGQKPDTPQVAPVAARKTEKTPTAENTYPEDEKPEETDPPNDPDDDEDRDEDSEAKQQQPSNPETSVMPEQNNTDPQNATASASPQAGEPPKNANTQSEPPKPKADATPTPATAAQLKEACPKAGADWVLGQLEAAATLDQACSAYTDLLEQRVDAANESAKNARATTPGRAQPVGKGVSGPSADDAASGADQFDQKVQALVDGGKDRAEAHKQVCRDHPDLRHAKVIAANLNLGRRNQAAAYAESVGE